MCTKDHKDMNLGGSGQNRPLLGGVVQLGLKKKYRIELNFGSSTGCRGGCFSLGGGWERRGF